MKVNIIDYDHLARGIARLDGKVIFIPKVKKGETVEVEILKNKANYAIAKNKNEIMKAPIFCPHYFICGGCHLQHLTIQEQLEFKCNKVKNIIEKYTPYHIRETLKLLPTKEKYYRNKLIVHIKGEMVGFYQEQTHQLFSLETCFLAKKEIQDMVDKIKIFVQKHHGLEEAMIRQLEEDIAISFNGQVNEELLVNYFCNDVCSITYNGKLIYGLPYITTKIQNKKFLVSQESFFQVNDSGLEKIYQMVIDLIKAKVSKNVLDLYCGTGTISLLISDYVKKVIGIEKNEQAIEDAKKNQELNQVSNVTFYAGDVCDILPKIANEIDTVIVDPPRSGLSKKVKDQIIAIAPINLIYISCDPLTLARDLKDLYDWYQLDHINLIDEFPQTYHVECVSLLSLKGNQKT